MGTVHFLCEVQIYQEKIIGTKKSKPEVDKLLENIRTGDVKVIAELTRLSRSTKDLLYLVGELETKGANIKNLKEDWVDTTTAQGKLMYLDFVKIKIGYLFKIFIIIYFQFCKF